MMTPKQERFCVEYLSTGNAAEAYQRAYGGGRDSARTKASALLRKANIQARLSELQAEVVSEKILTATEIQERLSSIARRELYETITLPNGEQVQKQTSIKDSCRALELLAKVNGMFITRQEVDIKSLVPVTILDDI